MRNVSGILNTAWYCLLHKCISKTTTSCIVFRWVKSWEFCTGLSYTVWGCQLHYADAVNFSGSFFGLFVSVCNTVITSEVLIAQWFPHVQCSRELGHQSDAMSFLFFSLLVSPPVGLCCGVCTRHTVGLLTSLLIGWWRVQHSTQVSHAVNPAFCPSIPSSAFHILQRHIIMTLNFFSYFFCLSSCNIVLTS